MRILVIILIVSIAGKVQPKDIQSTTITDNGIGRAIFRVYDQCDNSDDIIKCFKIQIVKLIGRALKVPNIKLLDGISVIRKSTDQTISRSSQDTEINNSDLETLSDKSLDEALYSRLGRFIKSHQIQVNVPRLLAFGQRNTEEIFSSFGSEGRKKDKKKDFLGPFIATVLLKAGILKIAYHSIAIVAGKALIVGKIALIISAIIGLKKLVSGESEKVSYEIVKHPKVESSHTYSSSHGEYEGGGHEGSSYHRSLNEEMSAQDKAFRAHVPRS